MAARPRARPPAPVSVWRRRRHIARAAAVRTDSALRWFRTLRPGTRQGRLRG